MFCKSCGTQLPDGTMFCFACGASQAEESAANSQPQADFTQVDSQASYGTPAQSSMQPGYGAPAQPNVQSGYGMPVQPSMQPGYGAPVQPSMQPGYGAPVQPSMQPGYGAPVQPNMQPGYGMPIQPNMQGGYGQANFNQGYAQELPMKWFKFVIYFQLFANAILNLISAVVYGMGLQYEGKAKLIYSVYDNLQTVDIAMAVVMVIFAIVAIVARFQLAGFKKSGPMFYFIVLILNSLGTMIYNVVVLMIIHSKVGGVIGTDFTRPVINFVVMMVVLVLNIIYFKKRKHLFVN